MEHDLLGSFTVKISVSNGTSEKIVLLFRTKHCKRKIVFHFFKAIFDTSRQERNEQIIFSWFQAFAVVFSVNGTDFLEMWTRFQNEIYQSWILICVPFDQTGKQPRPRCPSDILSMTVWGQLIPYSIIWFGFTTDSVKEHFAVKVQMF